MFAARVRNRYWGKEEMIRPLVAALCVTAVMAAGGCSTVRWAFDTTRTYLGTAQTEAVRQRALDTESTLSAAGFRRIAAKNAAEPSQVSSLPPLQISYYIDNGRFRYRFADPEFCRCVFEGDQVAYQNYERLRIAAEKERSDRQAGQIRREADQQTALDSVNALNPFRFNWF
jgi:hypothetical protein